MITARLLADLLEAGIQLWAEGDEVRFRAPKRALTRELRSRLLARKTETLLWLGQHRKHAVCSFAQRRLWFLDQLAPGNAAYSMPDAVRLAGSLDVPALAASFERMIQRHEILRTLFRSLEGRPIQVVLPAVAAELRRVDLSRLSPHQRDDTLRRLAGEEALWPFDLARGPLFRVTLFRLAPQEHVLLINLHHIISDGWSQGVLFNELTALYTAATRRRADPLPALPMQYADHAVRQRRQLRGEVLERQLAYWREQLEDLPSVGLFTDRPRPVRPSYRGGMLLVELPTELSTRLRESSRQAGGSLFMTLLAAFVTLLHRTTGAEDVAVGSPIANRTRTEIESLIGFFVNTLVLRTDVSGTPTFEELLRRVRSLALMAYAHQDLPFERLVEELQPRRDMSRNPFFQITFALQNAPRSRVQLPQLSLSRMEFDRHAVRLDLELFLWEIQPAAGGPPHLAGKIYYNADLFDLTTVQRLVRRFENLLHQVATDPERPLQDLRLTSAAEQHQLLWEWNPVRTASPPSCVHHLFEHWARVQPDAPAIVVETAVESPGPGPDARIWTYGELNRRANQLARVLRRHPVDTEALVGIYLERSSEAVLAALAVLKAGGAYLPLDPANPEERLRRMLGRDGHPLLTRVIVTREALREAIARVAPRARVVCLEHVACALANPPSDDLDVPLRPRQLAYSIFTSGSSGAPKGSALTHAGLANLATSYGETFQLAPWHKTSLLAAPGFDASVWELWSHLAAGASLHLPPQETELFPEALVDWLTSRRISHCFLPTPLAEALLASPALAQRPPATLRSLQAGGDRLTLRPPANAAFELLNLYGPTEATVVTVYGRVRPEPHRPGRPSALPAVAIGRPVAGCTTLVLDRRLALMPAGVPGELHLAGIALARGYIEAPAETARRFVPHPFSDFPGERLYKTGDRARQRGDGIFECLGRLDRQVKIRGLRIEPAEIEAQLARQSWVREAVVVLRSDVEGKPRLAAFVVPEPDADSRRSQRSEQHIDRWRSLYDDLYSTGSPSAGTAPDFTGWNHSATGEAISRQEMSEWVDHTVRRIRALNPRQLLEIGCGTGLLLWRLAPETRRYLATDFSRPVIDNLARRLGHASPKLPQVELSRRTAEDFTGIAADGFDTIVLNSVVQYFPSTHYLLRVLRGAIETLAPGGSIFLGDVRNLDLLEAFCVATELQRADRTLPSPQLHARAVERRQREAELVIDPDFFQALRHELPRLAEVRVQPKLGRARNELTRFRYDVTLHFDRSPGIAEPDGWLDGRIQLPSLEALDRRLRQEQPAILGLRRITDPRPAKALSLAELLKSSDCPATAGELQLALDRRGSPGIEPGALADLVRELPYSLDVFCSPDDPPGSFTAVFRHQAEDTRIPIRSTLPSELEPVEPGVERQPTWSRFTTEPLQAQTEARRNSDLRVVLRQHLPRAMVPAIFVELDALPLTVNGKIDRRALQAAPLADDARILSPNDGSALPIHGDEAMLAEIWEDVLGVEAVGVADNFFDLGGHSLLATQVVSRIRQLWGVELPLRCLFEHPTIRELAPVLTRPLGSQPTTEPSAAERFPAPPLRPAQRRGNLPLSFAQQRLWFLSQLDPDRSAYAMAVAFQLAGRLDRRALENALRQIAARHETLRTTFPSVAGRPVQRIAPDANLGLPGVDLTGLAHPCRPAATQALSENFARRPFDLAKGPLLRVALVRSSPQEHLLLIAQHHIISDGWSQGVLHRELSMLYAAAVSGQPLALPALPVQYADFALWQRRWLSGPALAARLSFWRRQLENCPPLSLPTDRPRPETPTYRGNSHPVALPSDLVDGLQRLSVDAGGSLFMTLLAAFATLLGRISGQHDIVLGSPIANRSPREVEELLGFFVNSLVLRTSLVGHPRFAKLLSQVRETTLEAYAHQDLPFEKLVEELQPVRDPSRNPLFQVWLALQNAPRSRVELQGLALTRLPTEIDRVRFDLELHVSRTRDGLHGSWLYATDLFDPSTIARWQRHFSTLLRGIVKDPQQRLDHLPLLSTEERHQLVLEWNDPAAIQGAGPELLLHELIADRARRVPDAIAVVSDARRSTEPEASLSFGQLERRAALLAERLKARGAGPDVVIGLAAERSIEMIVGLVAVLKSGAAFLPLDPSYPRDRLELMVIDSSTQTLLIQESVRDRLPLAASLAWISLDAQGTEAAEADGESHLESATTVPALDDAAYVIYTSGSTGRPKGVVNSHRGIVHHLRWMQDTYGLGARDVVVQKTPLSFDVSVWELFWPLITGARLVLARPNGHRDAAYLADLITRQRVSVAHFVPSLLTAFLNQPGAGCCRNLRTVIASGEALPRTTAERFRALLDAPLHNLYGPTEAAIDVTHHPYQGRGSHDSVAIGRPVAGTLIRVLDPHGATVPVGVAGELHIGGVQLARGYHQRTALTAGRFLPDPLSLEAGQRLYRTGDLVRRRPDGALEFLSRLDGQVKIRGVRIEPGEIEEVLRRHPQVREAAVLAHFQSPRGDSPADPHLVAYLAPHEPFRPERDEALGWNAEHTDHWREVYDELYAQDCLPSQRGLDLAGWDSSYTGEAIPESEMSEWIDRTVERILVSQPRKVLEIGCGTGLLLERLAPHCDEIVGHDFSPRVIADLESRLAGFPHLRLDCREATDFEGIAAGRFDTVVINSVVQYFPSIDTLLEVLRGAAAATAYAGTIYVGDVRSLRLLDAFCVSVELYQAPPTRSLGDLAERARQRRWRERELVVDPAFFRALGEAIPRLASVAIEPKSGRADNELTRFRYDVTLRLDTAEEQAADKAPEIPWLDWRREGWTLAALERRLTTDRPDVLGLRRVPNARLTHELRLLETLRRPELAETAVEELQAMLARPDSGAVEPEDLQDLARRCGARVQIGWGGSWSDGAYDVLFDRLDGGPPPSLAQPKEPTRLEPLSAYANHPLRDRRERQLVPQVREHVQRHLPPSMAPTTYVVLDSLPLSPSGKVDRGALSHHLPAPPSATDETAPPRPHSDVETILAGIWRRLLGRDRIGVHDNFFELGGHSLLATQVTSRLRQIFQVEISVRQLFDLPTVAQLATGVLEARRGAERPAAPPLEPVAREGRLPLSFAQQRLWLLSQMDGQSAAYHMPAAFHLRGKLDIGALRATLSAIVRRHEVLRTRLVAIDGLPQQAVCPADQARIDFSVVDLRGLSSVDQRPEAATRVREEATRPFDLASGSLLRTRLFELAEDHNLLTMCCHHIVSDGWSQSVLHREWSALYRAFKNRRRPALPELQVQYADFAVWQRRWMSGEVLEHQLTYWRDRLHNPPAALELPIDRPRPKIQSHRGDRLRLTIPAPLTQALEHLSRQAGTSLFMTFLASFLTLLHRITGQRDILVGTPIANRHHKEVEGLIGFFVNTLVLREHLSDDLCFRELLNRVRDTALEAYAHQDLPFERLVEEVQPERDLGRSPLFQVMLTWHNAPAHALRLEGLEVEVADSGVHPSKFDLELSLGTSDSGIEGLMAYNTDLFERTTIHRLGHSLRSLLAAVTRNPESLLGDLELLSSADRQAVLIEWNDTRRELGGSRRLHQLFAEQAELCPEAIALADGAHRWTFGQLAESTNRLAHHLHRGGIGSGDRVGVCLLRSADTVVAILAVLEVGAAYLPLDPAHPTERLAGLLGDARAAAWITRESHFETVAFETVTFETVQAASPRTVCLDRDASEIAGRPSARLEVASVPGQAAYVLYTSGSSGRPKGVVGSHRATVNRLRWMWDTLPFRTDEVTCHKTNAGFVDSVWEIFGPLLSGVPAVLIPDEEVQDTRQLIARLTSERVSRVILVPSLLRALLDVLTEQRQTLPHLRICVVSGEALTPDLAERCHELLPRVELLNLYGSTEVAADATSQLVTPRQSIAIGRPIANDVAYILDHRSQPVGLGVSGELCIGGLGLAQGYLDRPLLTGEQFIPDAWSGSPGARLYRTGDRARYLADGRIDFQGRLDHQFKIRGIRIEPGEIESALARSPEIAEAAVVLPVPAAQEGPQRLVAYFKPIAEIHEGAASAASASCSALFSTTLRTFLQATLPDVMIPAIFLPLETLPKTSSGKIDRATLSRLPLPRLATSLAKTRLDGDQRPPGEAILATIWCDVLGLEAVGRHENFFELGGHSLLATRVASRIRTAFAMQPPFRLLFEKPTISELAAALIQLRRRRLESRQHSSFEAPGLVDLHDSALQIPRVPIASPPSNATEHRACALSFAQERLWFLSRLEPDAPWYNLPTPLGLTGPLDARALSETLREIVRRHAILRSRFESHAGRPVQRVDAGRQLHLPTVDLSRLATDDRRLAANELADAEAQRLFDLEQEPPFRAALVRIRQREHLLLATFHHIAADGWSLQLFRKELGELYDAFSRCRPSPLPPLPVQYPDFAVWQRGQLTAEALRPHLAYWTHRLANLPRALVLPTDRPRPEVQRHVGGAIPWRLPEQAAGSLSRLCRDAGASSFMVLMASFMTWIQRLTHRRDIVVGTPIAGRHHEQVEPLIGCFFNTLALREHLSPDARFGSLVSSLRDSALDAYAFQDLPFERLVEELKPDRSLSRHPLFQVSLALQNMPRADPRVGDLEISAISNDSHTVRLDLEIYLWESGDTFAGHLVYDTSLFDQTTASRMARQWRVLLASAVRTSSTRLRDLPLLTRGERHQLLREWSRALLREPASEAPEASTHASSLHGLIEPWIVRTPDRIAVIWESAEGNTEALSYRELDRRTTALARRLQGFGVGAECRVGLAVDRTADMVIGMLGILRAGGAYLPLDTSSPPHRQSQILAAGRVTALVTSEEMTTAQRIRAPTVALHRREPMLVPSGLRAEVAPDSVHGDQLAYVVHTSGSTGQPKGVMVHHRGVVNAHRGWRSTYGLQRAPLRHLQMASLAFDVFTGDVVRALGAGGTLVIASRSVLVEPERLSALMRRQCIDCAEFVPAVALPLASHLRRTDEDLRDLRLLIVGSDHWTTRQLVELARVAGPTTRIVNSYGVSEATIDSSFSTPDPAPPATEGPVSVGRPFTGAELYVLDRRLQPMPSGAPGELCIAGVGVTRGYLNRPGLTAESFIPHPFGEAGTRLYRTGDRARHLPGGELELRGRIDHQVKVRGYRIELGEVETTLREHPRIADAAVVVRNGFNGHGDGAQRQLVAFLATPSPSPHAVRKSGALELRELRSFLAQKLPEAMIPRAFVSLESLPRNPNGKVDRRGLKQLGASDADVLSCEQSAATPGTTLENILAEIWQGVLGIEKLCLDDSFFALGGHSLLAVRLVARIERRLGVRLPLAALFHGATVREQAARLFELQDTEDMLVPLHSLDQPEQRSRPPFFCVHPVGGHVLCYADLAQRLGPAQRFFAIQARGNDGRAPFHQDLPEMARDYIESIRRVQPEGPYLLGGWSMGGLVAFEMASQLSQQGDRVALLALIDSSPLAGAASELSEAEALGSFAQHLGLPPSLSEDHLPEIGVETLLRDLLVRAQRAELLTADVTLSRLSHLFAVFQNNLRALAKYSPSFYPGEITLFRACESTPGDSADVWRANAEKIQTTNVPGDHFNILREPQVATLANELRRRLETHRAEQAPRRTRPSSPMEEDHAC